MEMLLRVAVQRCIGCGKCELACAFAHGAEGAPARSRIEVFRRGPEVGTPLVCLQCDDAGCQAACPTGALERNPKTGAIEVNHERCIKCRLCVAACPFGCIGWDETWRSVQKCDLCGGDPKCVRFCPTEALSWSSRPPHPRT